MPHLIVYMPAYHQAYAAFLASHPKTTVWLISRELALQLVPQIERDIRALPAADVATMLTSLHPTRTVHVLTTDNVKDVRAATGDLVLPDEDVSQLFAKKYLQGKKVTFTPIHLRWDGWGAAKETPVPPNRIVTQDAMHQELLQKAKIEAAKSPDWWRQVGAVVVKDGNVLLAGHNRPNQSDVYALNAYGDPRSNYDAGVSYDLATAEHGEAYVIGLAARKGIALDGAEMFVTTFPCPTCAKLIVTAGIKKVFYQEGYSLVDAEDLLTRHNVEIILVKN